MTISGIERRATVKVSVRSTLDEKLYEGSFVFRRPTFEDIGAIAAAESRLSQGETLVDAAYAAVIRAISELSVVVEEAPKWWNTIRDHSDLGVLMHVNTAYLRWKNKSPFRQDANEEQEPDDQSDESTG